ncbi:MAG: ThuA domain-containing protein [Lentisphaerales bacterium]|nr:ThuA domain-containing protein [Lentisphaerales bacterium]
MKFLLYILLAFMVSTSGAEPQKLKVLFLSGGGPTTASNHNGRINHHKLIPNFLRAGIDMTYSANKDDLNSENLAKYDALILYLSVGNEKPERLAALISYVENGGGLVALHNTCGAFEGESAFVKLIGGEFKGHGKGWFKADHVKEQKNHPALGGIPEFFTWDETYVHKNLNDDRTDLQTRDDKGRAEPWTWVRTQGKGRVFYSAHGHDGRVWENRHFQKMITAATIWASNKTALPDKDIPIFTYREDAEKYLHNYEKREDKQMIQNQISPEESAKCLVLPEGFEAQLIAHEPNIVNPYDITWDDRGRMFIAETDKSPGVHKGKGKDRIKICEDTDGDGVMDKFTVFAEHLELNTSICWVNGGIIVAQPPHMYFLKDTDGDDKADVFKKINTGWGKGALHGGPSNLKYSFDNKIYGCVGGIGHLDENEHFRAGIWHMDVDGSNFTPISNLGGNSWGLGLTEDFEIFASTANRNPAKHISIPYSYFDAVGLKKVPSQSIFDYWTFYPLTITRQGDNFGGYTAGVNFDIYTARSFPEKYWNKAAFIGGPTGKLLGQFFLEPDKEGSYRARNGESLVASFDEYTAPIKGITGPDGHLYMLDWHNLIILHGAQIKNPLRNKKEGRIYRIVHKDGKPNKVLDLSKADTAKLVETLNNNNLFWRMMAQQKIVQQKRMDAVPLLIKMAKSKEIVDENSNPAVIHALWSLHGLGQLNGSNAEALKVAQGALKQRSAAVRKNAVRVLPASEENTKLLVEMLDEKDSNTLRHILLSLALMPASKETGEKLYEMKEQFAKKQVLKTCYNLAFVRHGSALVGQFISQMPERDRSQEGIVEEKKPELVNLFENPSFEEVKDGHPQTWIFLNKKGKVEMVLDTTVTRSGKNSLRMSSKSGAVAQVRYGFKCEPGQYLLTGWVKLDNIESNTGVFFKTGGRGVQSKMTQKLTGTHTEWQKLQVDFRVSQETGMTVSLYLGGWANSTGTVWFDDMELLQLSSDKVIEKVTAVESLLAAQAMSKSAEDLIRIVDLVNSKQEKATHVFMEGLKNIKGIEFTADQVKRLKVLADDAAPKNQVLLSIFASQNNIDLGLSDLINSLKGFEAEILEGDPVNGKVMAASCVVCHGADFTGVATERAPSLAQLPNWYLQTQMQKYKHGVRGADVSNGDAYLMRNLMKEYSSQQIADIAAYIGTLKIKQPKVTVEDGDPVKGKELYNNCMACHQMDQHGNKALNAPGLAGLSDYYVVKQLHNFKNKVRGNGVGDKSGQLMQTSVQALKSEQDFKDIAAYINTLKIKK